jgi:hypothetical protein
MSIRICGQAYGQRCTLEIAGDTLTWRALRAGTAENIVTTVHDVRDARFVELTWSYAGLAIAILGVIWAASETPWLGALVACLGVGLVAWRRVHPRRFLILELADRRLLLVVDEAGPDTARMLVGRIDEALATGEAPLRPPTLP